MVEKEYSFDEINEKTGFAEGLLFDDEEDVLSYFLVSEMEGMFGECDLTQDELDEMAHIIIANKWHMEKGDLKKV